MLGILLFRDVMKHFFYLHNQYSTHCLIFTFTFIFLHYYLSLFPIDPAQPLCWMLYNVAYLGISVGYILEDAYPIPANFCFFYCIDPEVYHHLILLFEHNMILRYYRPQNLEIKLLILNVSPGNWLDLTFSSPQRVVKVYSSLIRPRDLGLL